MTTLDRAIAEIQKRPSVRTPVLASLLGLSDAEVDQLLDQPREQGVLITCDVEVSGKRVTEYRMATASPFKDNPTGHLFTPMKPKTAAAQASAASRTTAPIRPAAPVPAAAQEEEPMKEKKTVAERAIDAMRKHKCLTLEQLAKHAGSTKASLYTVMAELKKQGIRRVHGERGVYELATDAKAAKPAPKVKRKPHGRGNGHADAGLFVSTIRDLRERRDALLAEIGKLDRAIEAVEAIAA
jgi:biotin operon repressor